MRSRYPQAIVRSGSYETVCVSLCRVQRPCFAILDAAEPATHCRHATTLHSAGLTRLCSLSSLTQLDLLPPLLIRGVLAVGGTRSLLICNHHLPHAHRPPLTEQKPNTDQHKTLTMWKGLQAHVKSIQGTKVRQGCTWLVTELP
jgi:hypothetical protein